VLGPGLPVRYAICSNGAITIDLVTDEAIDAIPLSADLAWALVEQLRTIDSKTAFGCELHTTFIREDHYAPLDFVEPKGTLVGEFSQMLREASARDIYMLLAHNPSYPADRLISFVADITGEVVATHAGTDIAQITHADATKGNALERICERFGVALDEVAAFGDAPNDLTLFARAGVSFAVANGHESALEVADKTVPPNFEDGVAVTIRRLFDLDDE
jgi:hydroxymethylpyrimidine pyrophosphatase-like HAD family hydrolase